MRKQVEAKGGDTASDPGAAVLQIGPDHRPLDDVWLKFWRCDKPRSSSPTFAAATREAAQLIVLNGICRFFLFWPVRLLCDVDLTVKRCSCCFSGASSLVLDNEQFDGLLF